MHYVPGSPLLPRGFLLILARRCLCQLHICVGSAFLCDYLTSGLFIRLDGQLPHRLFYLGVLFYRFLIGHHPGLI